MPNTTLYRYTAHYTKTFVSGVLKGLSVPASCPQVSKAAASRFLKGVADGAEHEDALTGSRWTAKAGPVLPIVT